MSEDPLDTARRRLKKAIIVAEKLKRKNSLEREVNGELARRSLLLRNTISDLEYRHHRALSVTRELEQTFATMADLAEKASASSDDREVDLTVIEHLKDSCEQQINELKGALASQETPAAPGNKPRRKSKLGSLLGRLSPISNSGANATVEDGVDSAPNAVCGVKKVEVEEEAQSPALAAQQSRSPILSRNHSRPSSTRLSNANDGSDCNNRKSSGTSNSTRMRAESDGSHGSTGSSSKAARRDHEGIEDGAGGPGHSLRNSRQRRSSSVFMRLPELSGTSLLRKSSEAFGSGARSASSSLKLTPTPKPKAQSPSALSRAMDGLIPRSSIDTSAAATNTVTTVSASGSKDIDIVRKRHDDNGDDDDVSGSDHAVTSEMQGVRQALIQHDINDSQRSGASSTETMEITRPYSLNLTHTLQSETGNATYSSSNNNNSSSSDRSSGTESKQLDCREEMAEQIILQPSHRPTESNKNEDAGKATYSSLPSKDITGSLNTESDPLADDSLDVGRESGAASGTGTSKQQFKKFDTIPVIGGASSDISISKNSASVSTTTTSTAAASASSSSAPGSAPGSASAPDFSNSFTAEMVVSPSRESVVGMRPASSATPTVTSKAPVLANDALHEHEVGEVGRAGEQKEEQDEEQGQQHEQKQSPVCKGTRGRSDAVPEPMVPLFEHFIVVGVPTEVATEFAHQLYIMEEDTLSNRLKRTLGGLLSQRFMSMGTGGPSGVASGASGASGTTIMGGGSSILGIGSGSFGSESATAALAKQQHQHLQQQQSDSELSRIGSESELDGGSRHGSSFWGGGGSGGGGGRNSLASQSSDAATTGGRGGASSTFWGLIGGGGTAGGNGGGGGGSSSCGDAASDAGTASTTADNESVAGTERTSLSDNLAAKKISAGSSGVGVSGVSGNSGSANSGGVFSSLMGRGRKRNSATKSYSVDTAVDSSESIATDVKNRPGVVKQSSGRSVSSIGSAGSSAGPTASGNTGGIMSYFTRPPLSSGALSTSSVQSSNSSSGALTPPHSTGIGLNSSTDGVFVYESEEQARAIQQAATTLGTATSPGYVTSATTASAATENTATNSTNTVFLGSNDAKVSSSDAHEFDAFLALVEAEHGDSDSECTCSVANSPVRPIQPVSQVGIAKISAPEPISQGGSTEGSKLAIDTTIVSPWKYAHSGVAGNAVRISAGAVGGGGGERDVSSDALRSKERKGTGAQLLDFSAVADGSDGNSESNDSNNSDEGSPVEENETPQRSISPIAQSEPVSESSGDVELPLNQFAISPPVTQTKKSTAPSTGTIAAAAATTAKMAKSATSKAHVEAATGAEAEEAAQKSSPARQATAVGVLESNATAIFHHSATVTNNAAAALKSFWSSPSSTKGTPPGFTTTAAATTAAATAAAAGATEGHKEAFTPFSPETVRSSSTGVAALSSTSTTGTKGPPQHPNSHAAPPDNATGAIYPGSGAGLGAGVGKGVSLCVDARADANRDKIPAGGGGQRSVDTKGSSLSGALLTKKKTSTVSSFFTSRLSSSSATHSPSGPVVTAASVDESTSATKPPTASNGVQVASTADAGQDYAKVGSSSSGSSGSGGSAMSGTINFFMSGTSKKQAHLQQAASSSTSGNASSDHAAADQDHSQSHQHRHASVTSPSHAPLHGSDADVGTEGSSLASLQRYKPRKSLSTTSDFGADSSISCVSLDGDSPHHQSHHHAGRLSGGSAVSVPVGSGSAPTPQRQRSHSSTIATVNATYTSDPELAEMILESDKKAGRATTASTLLYRYPPEVEPPPQEICDFCLPLGGQIQRLADGANGETDTVVEEILFGHSQSKRSSRCFIFLLEDKTLGEEHDVDEETGHGTGKLYGICVLHPRLLKTSIAKSRRRQNSSSSSNNNQQQQYGASDRNSLDSSMHSAVTGVGTSSGVSGALPGQNPSGAPPSNDLDFIEFESMVCYAFITRFPFFEFFFQVIFGMVTAERLSRMEIAADFPDSDLRYSRQTYQYLPTIILEDVLERLTAIKPPLFGEKIQFSLSSGIEMVSMVRRRPHATDLSEHEYSTAHWALPTLLSWLPIETVVWVISLLLTEAKVIVVGNEYGMVSCAVMGLLGLLRPFIWVNPVIPMLPSKLMDFIESPVPVLVGLTVDDRCKQKFKVETIFDRCSDEDDGGGVEGNILLAVLNVSQRELYVANTPSARRQVPGLCLPGAADLVRKATAYQQAADAAAASGNGGWGGRGAGSGLGRALSPSSGGSSAASMGLTSRGMGGVGVRRPLQPRYTVSSSDRQHALDVQELIAQHLAGIAPEAVEFHHEQEAKRQEIAAMAATMQGLSPFAPASSSAAGFGAGAGAGAGAGTAFTTADGLQSAADNGLLTLDVLDGDGFDFDDDDEDDDDDDDDDDGYNAYITGKLGEEEYRKLRSSKALLEYYSRIVQKEASNPSNHTSPKASSAVAAKTAPTTVTAISHNGDNDVGGSTGRVAKVTTHTFSSADSLCASNTWREGSEPLPVVMEAASESEDVPVETVTVPTTASTAAGGALAGDSALSRADVKRQPTSALPRADVKRQPTAAAAESDSTRLKGDKAAVADAMSGSKDTAAKAANDDDKKAYFEAKYAPHELRQGAAERGRLNADAESLDSPPPSQPPLVNKDGAETTSLLSLSSLRPHSATPPVTPTATSLGELHESNVLLDDSINASVGASHTDADTSAEEQGEEGEDDNHDALPTDVTGKLLLVSKLSLHEVSEGSGKSRGEAASGGGGGGGRKKTTESTTTFFRRFVRTQIFSEYLADVADVEEAAAAAAAAVVDKAATCNVSDEKASESESESDDEDEDTDKNKLK